MREILQWHMLYDVMLKEVSQHRPTVSLSELRSYSAHEELNFRSGC